MKEKTLPDEGLEKEELQLDFQEPTGVSRRSYYCYPL